VRELFEKA